MFYNKYVQFINTQFINTHSFFKISQNIMKQECIINNISTFLMS